MKRDDATGLAIGGNKVRKLEYLLADALEQDADVVLTIGATQSNHCRQTAAAAARLGIECELLLEHRFPEWPAHTTGAATSNSTRCSAPPCSIIPPAPTWMLRCCAG